MVEKCVLCNEKIEDNHGKIYGTIVKAKNVRGVNEMIYVCSECQKKDDWINNAKIKGV